MTIAVKAFDNWIRTRFAQMNTQLEEIYFAQQERYAVAQSGAEIRQTLAQEGKQFIVELIKEGNTDEGFEKGFDLLGNVGLYMAACRRHELTEPSRETTSPLVEASCLALHLGACLGVTPRFATSHLATHNSAINGDYKRFTQLNDEALFIEFNTRGILAYKRAADALVRTLPLGISHPVTYHLLVDAKNALTDVVSINDQLFSLLDTERFFYCVRPYYKPYRVGQHIYRGANAGDFAGINEIDMLLGLCSADNQSYSQILVDKLLYMMPEDQLRLRDCMRRESLLNHFLQAETSQRDQAWYKNNLRAFLDVVAAHGRTAEQHHNQLVGKFIERPSAALPPEKLKNITASGPALEVLLASLEKLRDLRMAADRADIPSRHKDLLRLKSSLSPLDNDI